MKWHNQNLIKFIFRLDNRFEFLEFFYFLFQLFGVYSFFKSCAICVLCQLCHIFLFYRDVNILHWDLFCYIYDIKVKGHLDSLCMCVKYSILIKKKVSVNKRIQQTLYQMMLDFLIFINYTVLIYKISFSIKLLILSLLSVIFGHVKTIVQYMYCYWGKNWSGLKNYIDCENMCTLKYIFMFKL